MNKRKVDMSKSQDKDEKDGKRKDRKALVGRVKKAVKKSRRKLSEEKFDKELRRTIAFLEQIRMTLAKPGAEKSKPPARKRAVKARK
jgi:hypothetical protein